MAKPDLTITKAAALFGATALTALSASAASAATMTQTENFYIECFANRDGNCFDNDTTLSFDQFDPATGTLTGVTMDLSSQLSGSDVMTASVNFGTTVVTSTATSIFSPFNETGIDLGSMLGLATFVGTGIDTLGFDMFFDAGQSFFAEWNGGFDVPGTLTLTYEYDQNGGPTDVPLPASLGFLAAGLAGFGVVRRKAKST